MSRPLRIQYSGAWYHVMNRGLNRRRIFQREEDRQLFFGLLQDIHERYRVETHAYCLMDNHYHLILHTPEANLSRAMRHLDGVYTQRFNRSERRDGPLFRGRYKAILIEAEYYLLQLSRYIHLNPVVANLCAQAENYVWSSYRAYLQQIKRPSWLYCNEVLLQCSEKRPLEAYRKFVEEGIDENISKVFSTTQLPSLLGSQEWIEERKRQHRAENIIDDEIPAAKYFLEEAQPKDIGMLLQNVADYYKTPLAALKREGTRHAENIERNMFIYLAATCYGYENKEIARVMGNMSVAGVSKMRGRVGWKLENNKPLQTDFDKLKKAVALMSSV